MAVFSFLIAFTVGVGVAFLCYLVSRLFIKKRSAFYTASTVIRQVVCVCFLVALFFVGQKTSLDSKLLLIGGALGVTLPSFFFTSRLDEDVVFFNRYHNTLLGGGASLHCHYADIGEFGEVQ